MKEIHFSVKEIENILEADEDEATIAKIAEAVQNGAETRKAVAGLLKRREKKRAENLRLEKLYEYERQAAAEGYAVVAGTDEAGRGPLAGPVSVAAVILPPGLKIIGLNDSKKLSAKRREEIFREIKERAVCVEQVFVEPQEIDRVNILQATQEGMYRAIGALNPPPQKVLTDAVKLPRLSVPHLPIIKGDALSASIAAASIVAKVARDSLMQKYDEMYPQYAFAANKGYGTADHIEAIKKYGVCPIHRRSFEPIRSWFFA